jgi:DNA primase
VSNCGTALTKDQIRLIKRFTNNIIILFDSDIAGTNATIKAIDSILQQNMTPKILQLPPSDDPASFIKNHNSKDVYRYIEKKTIDFIEFKYNLIKKHNTSSLIKTTKSILESVALIDHKISQTFYIRRAAKILSINEEDLLNDLKSIKSSKNKRRLSSIRKSEEEHFNFSKIKQDHLEEFQLMKLLINYGTTEKIINNKKSISVAKLILLELEKDNIGFIFPLFDTIFKNLSQQIKSGLDISKVNFLTHQEENVRELAAYVIGEKHFLSNWQEKDIFVPEEKDILHKVTRESILRFKLKRVQQMVQDALSNLKNEDNANEKALQHFTHLSKLEKKIQQELGRLF